MLETTFEQQVKRLQSRWPRTYETELVAIFWRAFREVADDLFIAGVDDCIGNLRHAPMFQELDEAVARAKSRRWESEARTGSSSVQDLMRDAQRANKRASPEFVAECVRLLHHKTSGVITKQQFDEGMRLLVQAAEVLNPEIKIPR